MEVTVVVDIAQRLVCSLCVVSVLLEPIIGGSPLIKAPVLDWSFFCTF